jgi:hypothetical protein
LIFSLSKGQVLDSKEFYAPLITPYEAQLAFSPGLEWTGEYRLDFASLLHGGDRPPVAGPLGEGSLEPRFSLLDGSYHGAGGRRGGVDDRADTAGVLATRPSQSLISVDESRKHLIEVSPYYPW